MKQVNLPRLEEISIDGSVMWFAFGASLVSCLLFGLLPALKYSGSPRASALPTGGRTAGTSHRAASRAKPACGGTGLPRAGSANYVGPDDSHVPGNSQSRTGFHERGAGSGLQPGNSQVAGGTAGTGGTDAQRTSSKNSPQFRESPRRASRIPFRWTTRRIRTLFLRSTSAANAGQNPPVRTFKFVSPGLFAATGTRLIAGRDLEWADIHGRRPVVLVSENLARELWGSASAALGKRIHEAGAEPRWREVVGVWRMCAMTVC